MAGGKSQCEAILADFMRGAALTHLDAESRHKCARLAARALELKKLGHDIRKKMIRVPSGKFVAFYWLELPKGQLALFSPDPIGKLSTAYPQDTHRLSLEKGIHGV